MLLLPPVPSLPPIPQIHTTVLETSVPQEGVQQHIHVYTSTGGSTVRSGGAVQEGTSTSHIQVQTVINGETVTDINRTEVATGSSMVVDVVMRATTSSIQAQATSTGTMVKKGLFKRFISYVFSFFPF